MGSKDETVLHTFAGDLKAGLRQVDQGMAVPGDEDAGHAFFLEMKREAPPCTKSCLSRRNQNWIPTKTLHADQEIKICTGQWSIWQERRPEPFEEKKRGIPRNCSGSPHFRHGMSEI